MKNKIYVVVRYLLDCGYEDYEIVAVTTDKTKAVTLCNKWNKKYERDIHYDEDSCYRTYCYWKEYEDGYLDEEFVVED